MPPVSRSASAPGGAGRARGDLQQTRARRTAQRQAQTCLQCIAVLFAVPAAGAFPVNARDCAFAESRHRRACRVANPLPMPCLIASVVARHPLRSRARGRGSRQSPTGCATGVSPAPSPSLPSPPSFRCRPSKPVQGENSEQQDFSEFLPFSLGWPTPIGLVVGSCTSHPGVLGSIPKREEPGKTGAPCVKVPGSSRVPCNRSCSNKTHTLQMIMFFICS